MGAAALAVVTTLPPALSFCLSNPVACSQIAIAGGEIATGDALGPAGLAIGGVAAGKMGLKSMQSAEQSNAQMVLSEAHKVTDVMSVWSNGETWAYGWPVLLERTLDKAELEGFIWNFMGGRCQISCKENGFCFFKILPDQTGFITIDGSPGRHAYILNGDASVRFVLTPVFNVRGFDAERLAVVRQHDKERAKLSGRMIKSE